jgi:hypothetical protein
MLPSQKYSRQESTEQKSYEQKRTTTQGDTFSVKFLSFFISISALNAFRLLGVI